MAEQDLFKADSDNQGERILADIYDHIPEVMIGSSSRSVFTHTILGPILRFFGFDKINWWRKLPVPAWISVSREVPLYAFLGLVIFVLLIIGFVVALA